MEVDKRIEPDETAHLTVEFVVFALNGDEVTRTGYIWGPAPNTRGQKTFWVLPVGPSGAEPLAVAVVKASRRHQVGLVFRRAGRVRWAPKKGRYVDIDTWYTEEHPHSPTGAATAYGASPPPPPTSIWVPDLTKEEFESLSISREAWPLLP